MDRFQNLNLDLICTRYNGNELLFVRDLMAAGLISPVAPKCHGDMVLTSSKPWQVEVQQVHQRDARFFPGWEEEATFCVQGCLLVLQGF